MSGKHITLWINSERKLTPVKPELNLIRGFFELRPENYDAKLDRIRESIYEMTPEAKDALRPVIEARFMRD